MKYFLIFYISGLSVCLGLIILKIRYPELDNMLISGLAGVLAVPLIKEAFSRLRAKAFFNTLKRRRRK